ncbi:MAG: hypothetical protein ACU837_01500 [Gammaproteobacteria bacterium]
MKEAYAKAQNFPPCWGNSVLNFYIADIGFRINGLNASQNQVFSDLYKRPEDADLYNKVFFETWVYKQSLPIADPNRYNKSGVYTPIIKKQDSRVDIEAYAFRASIFFEPFLRGELYAEDDRLLATPIVFENYLRVLTAYAILMHGGLLLHSSGIVADGKAYLFLGRSGAGKTTLARIALAGDAKILSDDINIVYPTTGGSFVASAIPFAGELGHAHLEQHGRYPLGGLFWLEKSAFSNSASLAGGAQIAKLFACCPVVNADVRQLDRILMIGRTLLAGLPMRVLNFSRDDSFSAIYQVIQGSNNVSR